MLLGFNIYRCIKLQSRYKYLGCEQCRNFCKCYYMNLIVFFSLILEWTIVLHNNLFPCFICYYSKYGMFFLTKAFNWDISSWNVSSAETFVSSAMIDLYFVMTSYATYWIIILTVPLSFLQDSMFMSAEAFNQDISSWDVSNAETFVSVMIYLEKIL